MEKKKLKITDLVSWIGIIVCLILVIDLWKKGILTSRAELQNLVSGYGAWGELVFVVIQIVQVIIPIIPGGVSCLAGVLMFGAWKGFFLNYAGICIGSMIAFGISRQIGKGLLQRMFSEDLIQKYECWTEYQNRFRNLFALAIFFPFAPDDFLCYLAGTTSMKWKEYVPIILLGKPASIAIYSMGLNVIYSHLLKLMTIA